MYKVIVTNRVRNLNVLIITNPVEFLTLDQVLLTIIKSNDLRTLLKNYPLIILVSNLIILVVDISIVSKDELNRTYFS